MQRGRHKAQDIGIEYFTDTQLNPEKEGIILAKKLSGHKIAMSALTALWVVVTVAVLNLFHIETYWPTFTVLNLLTIIGFTKRNIAKIFLSCVAGVAVSLIYIYAHEYLSPLLGATPAGLLTLFAVIFAILALDELVPMFLNVHTIIVFAYCMVNAHEFAIAWPHTLISAFLGGGVGVAGILGIIKLSHTLTANKAAEH